MDDLKIEQDFLRVHCDDSMSTIYLAKNQVYHARMKHINVKYHFVRDVDCISILHYYHHICTFILDYSLFNFAI